MPGRQGPPEGDIHPLHVRHRHDQHPGEPPDMLRGSDVPRVSYLLPDTSLICLMSDMSPISVSPKSWLQCWCLIVSDDPSVSGVSAHVSSVRVSADVSTLLELHVHKPPPFFSFNQFIKFWKRRQFDSMCTWPLVVHRDTSYLKESIDRLLVTSPFIDVIFFSLFSMQLPMWSLRTTSRIADCSERKCQWTFCVRENMQWAVKWLFKKVQPS